MSYFEKCKELDFDDSNWKSYFFAECSRLAYHDGTRAKRHFKQVGFTTYKFFDVEGAQCHIAQNKDVIIIGMITKIEIWNPDKIEKYNSNINIDEFDDLADDINF